MMEPARYRRLILAQTTMSPNHSEWMSFSPEYVLRFVTNCMFMANARYSASTISRLILSGASSIYLRSCRGARRIAKGARNDFGQVEVGDTLASQSTRPSLRGTQARNTGHHPTHAYVATA